MHDERAGHDPECGADFGRRRGRIAGRQADSAADARHADDGDGRGGHDDGRGRRVGADAARGKRPTGKRRDDDDDRTPYVHRKKIFAKDEGEYVDYEEVK